jgi:hypothetical protein
MSVMDFMVSLLVVAEVWPTSEVGMPLRRSYVVLMRWLGIFEYGLPGGALNLNSANYPDLCHHGDPPLSGKNPHGRAGNWTRDLMINSQKCWPRGKPMYIFDHIALFLQWEMSQSKVVEKIKIHILCSVTYFSKIMPFTRYCTKILYCQTGHRRYDTCIACSIPKATNTHSEYVIFTALPLQLRLHEHTSVLYYTYIAWFV